jgi:hypothetical protein
LSAFGFVTGVLDVIEVVELTNNFPNIPNVEDVEHSTPWLLVVSIPLMIAGVIVLRKS